MTRAIEQHFEISGQGCQDADFGCLAGGRVNG